MHKPGIDSRTSYSNLTNNIPITHTQTPIPRTQQEYLNDYL